MEKSAQTSFLRSAYFNPSSTNATELVQFLNSICGKPLKKEHLRHYLFKVKWIERDLKLKARSNVQGGVLYIENLIQNGLDDINIACLKTTIADIVKYIEFLNGTDDTSFISISTNTLPSTIHFEHAKFLFFKKGLPTESNDSYSLDLLVLYALRMSLEKRVHGILGTDFVLASNKPIGLSKLLGIAKSLENVNYSSEVRWNEIEWVNSWINHHIHRNLRPYPWIIYQAIEVLGGILEPKFFTKNINSKGQSNYGSSLSKNLVELRKEVESKISLTFPGAEIYWSQIQEVQKID